jgi:ABC-type protease/lipase transport system fused ATPase/permease subunit
MDLQPWMAQVGVAGALTILLVALGKAFINHVAGQLREERTAHREEITRLTGSWEARLADCSRQVTLWETAANRWQAAALEDREQTRELLAFSRTTTGLLNAIREEQQRR